MLSKQNLSIQEAQAGSHMCSTEHGMQAAGSTVFLLGSPSDNNSLIFGWVLCPLSLVSQIGLP